MMNFRRLADYSRPLLLVSALFCFLVLTGKTVSADKLSGNSQDLQKIQQRIKQISANLEKKQVEEKDLKKDMTALEKETERLLLREKERKRSLDKLQSEIARQEKLTSEIREKSRQRSEMVKKRLAVMYRGGQRHFLRMIFSGLSPSLIAEEYHFLKRVVNNDRKLLENYRRDQNELKERLNELTVLRQKQQAELDDLKESRKTLADGRQLKKQLLARLQNQRVEMTDELTQLKEKAARLQALVKKLERVKPPEYTEKTGVFARQRGHLAWPVNGKIKVKFGTSRHPSLGTLYDCQGIEIETPKDRPIMAVWNGTVIFANQFKGYGNLIIVDHGDHYYTLYAQASRLAKTVGEKVKAGDTVAYSGYEGADRIYFEIRHRGVPKDPLLWLKSRS